MYICLFIELYDATYTDCTLRSWLEGTDGPLYTCCGIAVKSFHSNSEVVDREISSRKSIPNCAELLADFPAGIRYQGRLGDQSVLFFSLYSGFAVDTRVINSKICKIRNKSAVLLQILSVYPHTTNKQPTASHVPSAH